MDSDNEAMVNDETTEDEESNCNISEVEIVNQSVSNESQ